MIKIIAFLGYLCASTSIFATRPMKTGFETAEMTDQERAAYLRRLPHTEKERIAFLQLESILDSVIFQNLSYDDLKRFRFSLQDSDEERAQKYARLALDLQHSSYENITNPEWLIARCYKLAAELYSRTLGRHHPVATLDLHVSIAQFTRWSARFHLKACPDEWRLYIYNLLQSSQHLQKAEHILKEVESMDLQAWSKSIVEQNSTTLDHLTDAEILEIFDHPLDRVRFSGDLSWHEVYLNNKVQKSQEKLHQQGYAQQIIEKTISLYRKSLIEKLTEQTPPPCRHDMLQELRSWSQLKLYTRLNTLRYISSTPEDLDKVWAIQSLGLQEYQPGFIHEKIQQYQKKIEEEQSIIAKQLTQLAAIKKLNDLEQSSLEVYIKAQGLELRY